MFDKTKEEILKPQENRFTLFPVKYQDIFKLYVESYSSFWTPDEIDFSKDKQDWKKLNDNEKHFISHILAFFAGSDGIVNENLVLNFYQEIEVPEIRNLYAVQIMIEAIHSHVYSVLIDTLIENDNEKKRLFNAINTISVINKKAEWALKWISNKNDFNKRLLAFIVIEGVFFSGSFCAIYWIKTRNLLRGLTLSNEFISRDEALHCRTGIAIYNKLQQRLTQDEVTELFKEAVEIEEEFITQSLPVSLIGMNCELMKQYIRYVADYWLKQLGYLPIYKSKNPFPFMDYISVENKTDFFTHRVSNYQKIGTGETMDFIQDF
jgi:ribonucleotide reductase beta subunit family protein with ferritin-like domain